MSPSFFRKRLEFCFDKHNTKANYRALYSSDFDDQGENNLICPENTFSKNEMMTRSMLKTQAEWVHVFWRDPQISNNLFNVKSASPYVSTLNPPPSISLRECIYQGKIERVYIKASPECEYRVKYIPLETTKMYFLRILVVI